MTGVICTFMLVRICQLWPNEPHCDDPKRDRLCLTAEKQEAFELEFPNCEKPIVEGSKTVTTYKQTTHLIKYTVDARGCAD